jgi:hypothetical protein
MGDDKCKKFFGRNPKGIRPLGRPRRRWKNNIKMDLKQIWWVGMNWVHLAQDRD